MSDHALVDPDRITGLTAAEVADRTARGEVNRSPHTGRTTRDVLRDNLFTRFNALLGALLVVALVVAPPQDALFGLVLVSNAVIGIAQELRALRVLTRLRVLTAPGCTVRRDGVERTIAVDNVVRGDVVVLRIGDQVPADGTALHADGLELDEALLTGEADPVPHHEGDSLRSGCFVVAGSALLRCDAVGADAYANRITQMAKRYAPARSEIRDGIDTILRILTWMLVPVAVLVVIGQLRADQSTHDALRGTVAALVGMVPEGLVLLTSVAYSVGVVRTGRRGALVQELAALEGLARVDVVCLDKTGTLTEPRLRVVEVLAPDGSAADRATLDALGALVADDPAPNASARAIAEHTASPGWLVTDRRAFTSARRWSGVSFADHGSWIIGAPTSLLDPTRTATAAAIVDERSARGARVLVLATVEHLPEQGAAVDTSLVRPAAVVVIAEQVRTDAASTIAFFQDQGVAVRVISGDDPRTVGAIAREVGVLGADAAADATGLPHDATEAAAWLGAHPVLGRVAPDQKLAIVTALQQQGHVVAMTGDGVNDVPALKQADLGVAMQSGTTAARSVAKVVVTGGSFTPLPGLVHEGRRVLANMERVSVLFLTKTVVSILLAVVTGLTAVPFPLLPRQLTIVSTLTIGVPGFLLALGRSADRPSRRFVRRSVERAVPAGLLGGTASLVAYGMARQQAVPEEVQRTAALLALFAVSLTVLAIAARPLSAVRAAIVAGSALALVVLGALPQGRSLFALSFPSGRLAVIAAAIAALASLLTWIVCGDSRVALIRRSSPEGA